MAIYAISDLHLALSIDKPMDVFGGRWSNYMERIREQWNRTVPEDGLVLIPGDISWATYLEQAIDDFKFIDMLPGNKIISKGNHDYWWTTLNKLQRFLEDNGFSSIRFMHNNSFKLGKTIVCGSRGWICPGSDDFGAEDRKIYNRELQRLELSLKSTQKAENEVLIAALHYPPFNSKREPTEFVEIMQQYNVNVCIYGHLHGESFRNAVVGRVAGVDFQLVSADYLGFKPLELLREV